MIIDVRLLNVQVVVGPSSRSTFENVILPRLVESFSGEIHVHVLDYSGRFEETSSKAHKNLTVSEYSSEFENGNGFGANHNYLFLQHRGKDPFLVLNPDCYPAPHSVDLLLRRFDGRGRKIGIVEGRQWPFAHPKEYDHVTFETPWASAAFCAISGEFFESVGGFDTRYGMYLEDVDLSWTAWKKGWRVLHEPSAGCFHFSEGFFYRRDLGSLEERVGKCNFVKLLEKFFGNEGLRRAAKELIVTFDEREATEIFEEAGFGECLVTESILDFSQGYSQRRRRPRQITVDGYNKFHRFETEVNSN